MVITTLRLFSLLASSVRPPGATDLDIGVVGGPNAAALAAVALLVVEHASQLAGQASLAHGSRAREEQRMGQPLFGQHAFQGGKRGVRAD